MKNFLEDLNSFDFIAPFSYEDRYKLQVYDSTDCNGRFK